MDPVTWTTPDHSSTLSVQEVKNPQSGIEEFMEDFHTQIYLNRPLDTMSKEERQSLLDDWESAQMKWRTTSDVKTYLDRPHKMKMEYGEVEGLYLVPGGERLLVISMTGTVSYLHLDGWKNDGQGLLPLIGPQSRGDSHMIYQATMNHVPETREMTLNLAFAFTSPKFFSDSSTHSDLHEIRIWTINFGTGESGQVCKPQAKLVYKLQHHPCVISVSSISLLSSVVAFSALHKIRERMARYTFVINWEPNQREDNTTSTQLYRWRVVEHIYPARMKESDICEIILLKGERVLCRSGATLRLYDYLAFQEAVINPSVSPELNPSGAQDVSGPWVMRGSRNPELRHADPRLTRCDFNPLAKQRLSVLSFLTPDFTKCFTVVIESCTSKEWSQSQKGRSGEKNASPEEFTSWLFTDGPDVEPLLRFYGKIEHVDLAVKALPPSNKSGSMAMGLIPEIVRSPDSRPRESPIVSLDTLSARTAALVKDKSNDEWIHVYGL